MKEELKAVYNAGKKVLAVPKWAFLLTHASPTACRIAPYEETVMYSIFGSIVYSSFNLSRSLELDNPYFFGAGVFCIASNVASGLYELYRYEKNKINNPAVSTAIPSSPSLEEKVEEKPLEVFDPWKIEIDELENIAYGGMR